MRAGAPLWPKGQPTPAGACAAVGTSAAALPAPLSTVRKIVSFPEKLLQCNNTALKISGSVKSALFDGEVQMTSFTKSENTGRFCKFLTIALLRKNTIHNFFKRVLNHRELKRLQIQNLKHRHALWVNAFQT
ncbi:hypothetical protein C2S52_011711 [Perilla frutescens var. hirtella]|nr:hypothetical protein C2S52_011711 [Perilla frutescens var. hirtella]